MARAVTRAFIRGRHLAAFALVAATAALVGAGNVTDVRAYRSAATDLNALKAVHGEIGEVLAALALFTIAPGTEAERYRQELTPRLEALALSAPLVAELEAARCDAPGHAGPDCSGPSLRVESLKRDFQTFVTLSMDLTASSAMRVGPGAPRLQVLLHLSHHVVLPKVRSLNQHLRHAHDALWTQLIRGAMWRLALVCAVALAAAVLVLIPLERRILSAQSALERETRRAQEAERSKGAFLANMSHEIRTALNGVIGVAELLGRTRLDAEQSEYLRIMGASGSSLLRLINDILDYSKLGAGELSIEVARFDPRRILVEVAQLAAPMAGSKGLALDLDIDPHLPRQAMGDGVRLRQIVSNLLQNAVKFTGTGRVEVTAEWRANTRIMVVSVRDTGVGIPPDKLEAVFRAFQQVDNGLTPRHHGTGLGLAIAKMLTERMGGRLNLQSVEGEGSCFTVAVPLGPAPEVARALAPPLTGRRVALAGGAGVNALARTLAAAGAEIIAAEGPDLARADAIVFGAPLAPEDPDDARAPEESAAALTRASAIWRRIAPGARIVVVAPRGATVTGVDAALAAPLDPDAVVEAVRGGAPARAPSANGAAGAGLRVLVADDNPVNRMIAERLLQAMGAHVDCAEDGRAAVEATARGDFDLVLMDVTMPVMNGLQAAGEIRRREAGTGRRTPIVALTAHALDEHRERCVEAGMDDHLGKPFRARDLAAMLARWAPTAESLDAAPGERRGAA